MRHIISHIERWPIAGTFRISRSSLTEVVVVKVSITDGKHTGYGECRPYARYSETAEGVCAQIATLQNKLHGLTTETLQDYLPAGAARNAVDCALWDLKAQTTGVPVSQLLNLLPAVTRQTAYTLSVDTPKRMKAAAIKANAHGLLKIKIADYDAGLAAALAILKTRPDAELIIDANEALTSTQSQEMRRQLAGYPVVLIEQPMPSAESNVITNPDDLPIVCADESLHTRSQLCALHKAGYRAVNVKLDKTGGLTEAIALIHAARAHGFVIMIGCMVGTSLAMAPATLLMRYADVVDLDGALLLSKDREPGIHYHGESIDPSPQALWGHPRGNIRVI